MKQYYQPYADQMFGAKKRGIDWQFTYDEWVNWWGDDITKRGPYRDQLVMARYNDEGAYHPNNCYKTTASENCKERQRIRKETHGTYVLNRW